MKTAAILFLLVTTLAKAQLAVNVSTVKVTGSKAIVSLAMQNNFTEKIESARAVVFLLDEQGKMAGQATRWIIGGSEDKPGLAAGTTNTFHFVITSNKPFTTTNLTAKLSFSRLVLEGGKLVDAAKGVVVGKKP